MIAMRGSQVQVHRLALRDHRLVAGRSDPVDPHRFRDVLQVAGAEVFDFRVQVGGQPVAQFGGDHEFARPGEAGDAGGEVDVGAVDVVAVDHEFRQVGADPQVQLAVGAAAPVGLRGQLLQAESRADATQCVIELQHQAVTEALEQAAAVERKKLSFGLIDQRLPARHKFIFVLLHQADRLHHVHHHQDLRLAFEREFGVGTGGHRRRNSALEPPHFGGGCNCCLAPICGAEHAGPPVRRPRPVPAAPSPCW